MKDQSNNELAHILLIGGTHNKQGSKECTCMNCLCICIKLIKILKYYGAVL